MIIKYNRELISFINCTTVSSHSSNSSMYDKKKAAVPEMETFKYILKNAIKGNEMAATLIDEWQRFCKTKDENEKEVVKLINSAAHKIFK